MNILIAVIFIIYSGLIKDLKTSEIYNNNFIGSNDSKYYIA